MQVYHSQSEYSFPSGNITLLGAYDDVTPTCNIVEINNQQVLIDCGISFDGTLPKEALQIDTVILTHAHFDHIGGLPELLLAGKIKQLFATPATLEIAKHLLIDSIRIKGGHNDDCRRFSGAFKRIAAPVRYGQPTQLKNSSLKFTLHEAGHILGSASVELKDTNSRVIISGDLGRPNSPLLRDYHTQWDTDTDVDMVLLESTYGSRCHDASPKELEAQLETTILRSLQDGGHILVPSFAIGRTQTLLYLLNTLVESNRIPELPVAVDTPLGLKVTNTYKRFQRLYDKEAIDKIEQGDDPIDFDSLFSVKRSRDSKKLDELSQPCLIIAGSGMCTGGRIVGHLQQLLELPQTNVIFVGYQAKHTPGAYLQAFEQKRTSNEPGTLEIGGQTVEVRAQIDTLPGISAHADQEELTRWLKAVPNVKNVALHHGNHSSQTALAKKISGSNS